MRPRIGRSIRSATPSRPSARAAGRDADEDLATHIGAEGVPERFWEEVATNLHAGRLRLVFVADVIPHQLRRIVEFLDEQMTRTDVLAIEVRQYVAPGSETITLVPRLIGQTEAARDAKRVAIGRSRMRWSEPDLIKMLREAHPGEQGDRMVRLYEFLRDRDARASWGTGAVASVTMWLGEGLDGRSNPVSISIYRDGIAINFDFVRDKRTTDEMQRRPRVRRHAIRSRPAPASVESSSRAVAIAFHATERCARIRPIVRRAAAYRGSGRLR